MKKVVPKVAHLIPDNAKRVFKGEIYDTYQWPQKMFDGSTETFEMLKRPDTVTAIPIADGKVITLEDRQPHTGKKMSFPGGRVDEADQSTLAAVKREVKEETGYEFDKWKLVNVTQPHAKLEWFIYFYIAWDGRKTAEPHLDAGEQITLDFLDFDKAKNFVITKSGYLGESMEVFDKAASIEELINFPEFKGQEINRE